MGTRFAAKSALAICITLACSGAVLLPTRAAHAKPPAGAKASKQPIGVGTVTGPQGAKVRTKLLKVLRDSGSYEVTDAEDVKPGSPPATYQAMAQGIAADAIIVGTVSKAMNLTLSVYGANGARVDAVTIKGGSFPKLFKGIDNELEIAVADPLERSRSGAGKGKPPAAAAAAAAPPPGRPPKKKLAPGEAEDEEEAEVDDVGAAKGKGKGKAAPPAKTKPKGDELESEDISDKPADDEGDASSSSTSSEPPSEGAEHGLRPLELTAGVRGYNRNFTYTSGSQGLSAYPVTFALGFLVEARVFPGAFFGDGTLTNIGFEGRLEYGIPTPTNYAQAATTTTPARLTKLTTQVYEYQFGIRGRIPLGKSELGIFGLYGDQSFSVLGDETPPRAGVSPASSPPYAVVPDVHYHYLRIGLDARFYISKLMVGGHVAPRFLTAMKELDKAKVWFPGATGSGLDIGMLLGWQILPWLQGVGGIDMVRYGFDFNNSPAVPARGIVAGGATDTFVSGWLGAMGTFGGPPDVSASVSAETTEDEPKSKSDDEEEDKPKAAPPPAKKPAKAPAKKKAAAPKGDEEEEEE